MGEAKRDGLPVDPPPEAWVSWLAGHLLFRSTRQPRLATSSDPGMMARWRGSAARISVPRSPGNRQSCAVIAALRRLSNARAVCRPAGRHLSGCHQAPQRHTL